MRNHQLTDLNAQQTVSRINITRYIIAKLLKTKDKEKILKSAKEEKNITYN